jgi:hypothetical protein
MGENKYDEILINSKKLLIDLLEEKVDSWNFIKEKEGIKFYKKRLEISPLDCMRTTCILNYNSKLVNYVIMNKMTDYNLKGSNVKIIDQISESEVTMQMFCPFNSLFVSDRDFIYVCKNEILKDDNYLMFGKSVEHEQKPSKNIVRGEIFFGFRLTSLEKSKTLVEYIELVDPKGSLPSFMVNLVNNNVLDRIIKLKNCVKDNENTKI